MPICDYQHRTTLVDSSVSHPAKLDSPSDLRTWASTGRKVRAVNACQRYPWNGLVDIAVTMECSADDVAMVECAFSATNTATRAALPIAHITQNGIDTGSGATWTRRFIWDAAADAGTIKIDDLALTVNAKLTDCVQLWENGPYWAECNVGATKPEEYGYYFWWGDTVGYKRNANNGGWISVKDGSSFSFSSGNCPTYGMNNSQLQSAGYIDATGNLTAAHDTATAHLGAPWRMPTGVELSELVNNCDTTWVMRGGVSGRLVTGRGAYASKSIFLPAAGECQESDRYYVGVSGCYWSSTLFFSYADYASSLDFGSKYFVRSNCYRCFGLPVRPLRGFAEGMTVILQTCATTRLKLDCRMGVHTCSANGENLRYDASWHEDGIEVRITENETVVTTGSAGFYTWLPAASCSTRHVLKLEVLSDGQVVGTEMAEFESEATLSHSEVVTTVARAATCTEAGCTKGSYCSRCNEALLTSTALPALGHVEVVTTAAKNPTCAEDGCTKGSYCSRCNAILSVSEVLPGGHIGTVTKAAIEPTSVADGSTAEITCSRCYEILQAAEMIPSLGYIRNVTARQLWPHKKVEVCYTLADDIGEVAGNDELRLSACVGGNSVVENASWTGSPCSTSVWKPLEGNVLAGLAGVFSGTRYTENYRVYASDSLLWLTDGAVNSAGGSYGNTIGITSGSITWTLPEAVALSRLRVNTHWGDGGRDGVAFDSVSVRKAGDDKWTVLPNSGVNYGIEDHNTSGDLEVVYRNSGDEPFAVNVAAVRFNFGVQEYNTGTGYTEFEAVGTKSTVDPQLKTFARTIIGDISCAPGLHRVVWDMGADSIQVADPNLILTATYGPASGHSEEIIVDTSSTVEDGMSVGSAVNLDYSPIAAKECELQIDGLTILSSTNSGTFAWQPQTKGEHTIAHIAGTNVWTRTVNVTALTYEPPVPQPPEVDANIVRFYDRLTLSS